MRDFLTGFFTGFLFFFAIVILFVTVPDAEASSEKFDAAVKVVLKHEGGLTDHPSDPGGKTNFGVSLRYLKSIGYDVDGDGDVDGDDIKKLTQKDAINIYRKNWWDKYRYNQIIDQNVATKVFDTSINTGHVRSHKIAQQSINELIRIPIAVDGKFGVVSFYYLNQLNSKILVNHFRANQQKFYERLVVKNPKLKPFIRGWVKRAQS